MNKLAIPFVVFAILAGTGCKSSSLAGTYKYQTATLILKDDKTASIDGGKGPNSQVAGKWAEENGKVVIATETIGGKSVDQALAGIGTQLKPEVIAKIKSQLAKMELTESEDKKTLSLTAPGSTQSAAFVKNTDK